MGNTKTSLQITLFSCMSKKVSSYTKASVNKLRELLAKRHNKEIERRWAFYCLADLEAEGLITRRVRIINNSDGTVRQLSSMIAFTIKGLKLLISMKVEGSILALKNKITWLKGQDKRFPEKPALTGAVKVEMDPRLRREADSLIKKVYKPFPA